MGDYLGNSRPPVHKTMIMTTPGKVETVDWSNAPIGLEPPGIPVDKSPVVNVYLDDTPYQPEKEYQIKSGDEIIMTPPLIAYDLPASFDKMNHALKHGFKPGEMQVISSLKPGKSMLGAYAAAVKNLPKTMMELRTPTKHPTATPAPWPPMPWWRSATCTPMAPRANSWPKWRSTRASGRC